MLKERQSARSTRISQRMLWTLGAALETHLRNLCSPTMTSPLSLVGLFTSHWVMANSWNSKGKSKTGFDISQEYLKNISTLSETVGETLKTMLHPPHSQLLFNVAPAAPALVHRPMCLSPSCSW